MASFPPNEVPQHRNDDWKPPKRKYEAPLQTRVGRVRLPDRERLYCEQSASCHYCGRHTVFDRWAIDRRIPLARGGSKEPGNMVGACADCVSAKGSMTETEYFQSTNGGQ